MEPSHNITKGAPNFPSAANLKGAINVSPALTANTGWCKITLATPGNAPFKRFSTDGLVAPTVAIEQPSQLPPAIQKA